MNLFNIENLQTRNEIIEYRDDTINNYIQLRIKV